MKALLKGGPGLDQATRAFENLVDAWKTCTITGEIEHTKRESIKAIRDTNIKSIEKNADILKQYLEGMFKERAAAISSMFERLDKGIADGNPELASMAIDAIVAITKQSPLAGAREILSGMHNPDVKIIEI